MRPLLLAGAAIAAPALLICGALHLLTPLACVLGLLAAATVAISAATR